jgi:SAM-dependent methyltransferase
VKEEDIRPRALFDRYLALAEEDTRRFFRDRSDFEAVSCPACLSNAASTGLTKLEFRYLICDDCGSLFMSPRPPAASIDRYYREGAAVKFWATDFFRETAEARRAAIFEPRGELMAGLVREHLGPVGGTFVDVGSGYGIFLDVVSELGLFDRVIGVEPSPDLARACRDKGHEVIEATVEEVGEALGCDMAVSFEVLEHLYDPGAFLTAVRRLLRPGGMLLFTTLTVTGFDIQVLWERSKSVHPPHHVNLLSVRGMQELVARSGLELVDLSTPGKLDVDIVRNNTSGRDDAALSRFERAVVWDSPPAARQAFQQFLAAQRLSSHIRVVARRPEEGH